MCACRESCWCHAFFLVIHWTSWHACVFCSAMYVNLFQESIFKCCILFLKERLIRKRFEKKYPFLFYQQISCHRPVASCCDVRIYFIQCKSLTCSFLSITLTFKRKTLQEIRDFLILENKHEGHRPNSYCPQYLHISQMIGSSINSTIIYSDSNSYILAWLILYGSSLGFLCQSWIIVSPLFSVRHLLCYRALPFYRW